MKLLLIGHLLGDFYFQSSRMAEDKKSSLKALGLHGLLYTVVVYLFMAFMTGSFTLSLLPVGIIGITHGIIDFLKIRIEHRKGITKKCGAVIFTADQMLHIGVMFLMDVIFNIKANVTWLPDVLELFIALHGNILTVIIAVLLCGKPAAIMISVIFGVFAENALKNEDSVCVEEAEYKGDSKDLQIGSWIGILEREIMLLLGLMGQYGAIGFVLTAKSLARYKQLEDKSFAEKYLVGTLLSSLIALLCIAMCEII